MKIEAWNGLQFLMLQDQMLNSWSHFSASLISSMQLLSAVNVIVPNHSQTPTWRLLKSSKCRRITLSSSRFSFFTYHASCSKFKQVNWITVTFFAWLGFCFGDQGWGGCRNACCWFNYQESWKLVDGSKTRLSHTWLWWSQIVGGFGRAWSEGSSRSNSCRLKLLFA